MALALTVITASTELSAQEINSSDIRTPWGDPDFQGIWNNSTTTPLERMTDAERERGLNAQAPVIEATPVSYTHLTLPTKA